MLQISIIVVSYNTSEILQKCLNSLLKCLNHPENKKVSFEIFVVDNASTDNSVASVQKIIKSTPQIKLIVNKENLGFGKANNIAIKQAEGEYILLLNSDVIVEKINFVKILEYMRMWHRCLGAYTVKVKLCNGKLDEACHRGFPTLWRSFCYFIGLEKLAKLGLSPSKFGGYHLVERNLQQRHEIDSGTAAFYMIPTRLLKQLNGFDEDYFMYGEDLDLSYRIKKLGYKIIYDPQYEVVHLKSQSGLKKTDKGTKSKTQQYFYEAMKIFYQKHYAHLYGPAVSWFVIKFIRAVQIVKSICNI